MFLEVSFILFYFLFYFLLPHVEHSQQNFYILFYFVLFYDVLCVERSYFKHFIQNKNTNKP